MERTTHGEQESSHASTTTLVDPDSADGTVSTATQGARPRIAKQTSTRLPAGLRVSVVIPTLNEARNLPHVFAELPAGLHEVIVVDGYSTDGTAEAAKRLRPGVRIIEQERPGKGDALRCGLNAATGDVLVTLDADGSADPAEIPRFVQALTGGADYAKGTRFAHGGGSADITPLRRAGNKVFSSTVNVLFRTRYSDLCYGYNAFWRHCLPAVTIDCDGFEIETLMNIRVARAGLAVAEVPSFERRRIHGQSNLNTFRDGARVLRTILRERVRSRQPVAALEASSATQPSAAIQIIGTASGGSGRSRG